MPSQNPPGRRFLTPAWLTGLLVLSVAVFTAEDLRGRRSALHSLEVVKEAVFGDAMPSVIELLDVRRAERELRTELRRAADAPSIDGRVREIRDERLSQLHAHYESYLRYPAYADEVAMRAHLPGTIAELKDASDAVLKASDGPAARRILDDRFTRAADDFSQTISELIQINVVSASKAMDDALDARERDDDRAMLLLALMAGVVVALGITAHRLLTRAQAESERRLEELDAFAARVAHDLRGPLSPVALALSLLEKSEHLTASQERAIEAARRSVARMVALIEGLLRFARAAARPDPGARCAVDAVVADQVSANALVAREERAQVSVDVTPGLEVAASAAVFGSIVENLMRNALLHLGECERREVVVRARGAIGFVEIDVQDTGPGIPPDVARRLFRPFERGSNRPGGHGLGLATVKRLAEAHGGSVALRSAVGEGSTFTVRLPRASTASAVA